MALIKYIAVGGALIPKKPLHIPAITPVMIPFLKVGRIRQSFGISKKKTETATKKKPRVRVMMIERSETLYHAAHPQNSKEKDKTGKSVFHWMEERKENIK
jgi:hypothetical protein